MGALGIRAAAAKSCPVSPAGRHFTKRSMYEFLAKTILSCFPLAGLLTDVGLLFFSFSIFCLDFSRWSCDHNCRDRPEWVEWPIGRKDGRSHGFKSVRIDCRRRAWPPVLLADAQRSTTDLAAQHRGSTLLLNREVFVHTRHAWHFGELRVRQHHFYR